MGSTAPRVPERRTLPFTNRNSATRAQQLFLQYPANPIVSSKATDARIDEVETWKVPAASGRGGKGKAKQFPGEVFMCSFPVPRIPNPASKRTPPGVSLVSLLHATYMCWASLHSKGPFGLNDRNAINMRKVIIVNGMWHHRYAIYCVTGIVELENVRKKAGKRYPYLVSLVDHVTSRAYREMPPKIVRGDGVRYEKISKDARGHDSVYKEHRIEAQQRHTNA
jgi:hypothetical protein